MFCENFIYVYFICAGEFGVVYKGWYTSDGETVEVAIKRTKGCIFEYMQKFHVSFDITEFTSSDTVKEFITECNIANKFNHPNVLSLIGVTIDPEDDVPQMVMPYMLHGDVKSYLKLQRGDSIEADRLPKVNISGLYFLIFDAIVGTDKENYGFPKNVAK